PGGGNRAHIHTSVSGRGLPERWIDNYIFADDPLVTSDVRARFEGLGRFSPVLTLTRAPDGVLRGVRDIRVERAGV
ncbi:MAG TPA: hypothetical protein VGV38_18105, partial [Pyrinomonadaceae bacterium]|nr:hypothetical protein [Pyrinomonadaceae bacterium]